MAGADGTIVIDIDIPVNKVRTDSQEIKSILNAIEIGRASCRERV